MSTSIDRNRRMGKISRHMCTDASEREREKEKVC